MEPENSFDRLARRDSELRSLSAKGRRRALGILVLASVAAVWLIMLINHDVSVSAAIPIAVVYLVVISYSWHKWQRHPEETQSIAFIGLDRRSRWSVYRSMWRRSGIDDPVVLTIFESMYAHVRRSFAIVIASMCAAAVLGVALVQAGGGLYAGWISIEIVALLVLAVVQQRWMIKRAADVIDQSRAKVPGGHRS